MGLADEDLRHGRASASLDRHRRLAGAIAVDADLLERRAFAAQQVFGGAAVGAGRLGVDDDRRQDSISFRARAPASHAQHTMGVTPPVTTRANTSRSTRAAPPRSSARAAALAVAPEVSTSSTRTIRRPCRAPSRRAERPLHVRARCSRVSPTWLRVALTRSSASAARSGLPLRAADRAGERRGLIEPPLPQPQRMQRHRHDRDRPRPACRRPPAPSRRRAARARSPRSEYLSRWTSRRAGPSSNRATARARRNTGGSAIACGDSRPSPRSCSNGVPSRSQNGRSMKRIARQQAGQSAPCAPVAARQARQVGGKSEIERGAAGRGERASRQARQEAPALRPERLMGSRAAIRAGRETGITPPASAEPSPAVATRA